MDFSTEIAYSPKSFVFLFMYFPGKTASNQIFLKEFVSKLVVSLRVS